jgi:dUTPase
MWRSAGGTKNLSPPKWQLRGLGNTRINNFGEKIIRVNLPGNVLDATFQIVEDLHDQYDGILGLDIIQDSGAIIDVGAREFRVRGVSYPLILLAECSREVGDCHRMRSLEAKDNNSIIIRLKKGQQLEAGTQNIIYVSMPLINNTNQEYVIEGDVDSNLHVKHIFVVRCLVKTIRRDNKYFIPVSISNLGQQSVKLRKGQRLALLHELQVDDLDDVTPQQGKKTAEVTRNVHKIEATMVNNNKRLDDEHIEDIQRNLEEDNTIEFIDELEVKCLDDKEVKRILEGKIKHVEEEAGKRGRLRDLLHEFIDLFNPPKYCFPKTSKVEHRIVTTTEEPIYERPSRIPHHLQPVVKEMIDDQLQKQIIREVVSPWNARLVMVRKKSIDGSTSYRATIDLRS